MDEFWIQDQRQKIMFLDTVSFSYTLLTSLYLPISKMETDEIHEVPILKTKSRPQIIKKRPSGNN